MKVTTIYTKKSRSTPPLATRFWCSTVFVDSTTVKAPELPSGASLYPAWTVQHLEARFVLCQAAMIEVGTPGISRWDPQVSYDSYGFIMFHHENSPWSPCSTWDIGWLRAIGPIWAFWGIWGHFLRWNPWPSYAQLSGRKTLSCSQQQEEMPRRVSAFPRGTKSQETCHYA